MSNPHQAAYDGLSEDAQDLFKAMLRGRADRGFEIYVEGVDAHLAETLVDARLCARDRDYLYVVVAVRQNLPDTF